MLYLVNLSIIFLVARNAFAMDTVYMDQLCGQTKNISGQAAVRVQLTSSSSYNPNMDCTFTLYGGYRGEDRLMIDFKDLDTFDLNGDLKTPCPDDWLTLYDGGSSSSSTIGDDKNCGTDTPITVYTTSGSDLAFYFHSDGAKGSTSYTGFHIILTHFNTDICDSWEFECNNGRCIDANLACNGNNPCGDSSDCPSSGGPNTTTIVLSVIGSVAFFIVCGYCCCGSERTKTVTTTVTVTETSYLNSE